MSVLASAATRYPDSALDVTLRDWRDGMEAPFESAVAEWPVPINDRFRTGVVSAVVHVLTFDPGGGEFFIDLVSCDNLHGGGEDKQLLVRASINGPGQFQIGFDAAVIPDHHVSVFCRLLSVGTVEPTGCQYGCWLCAVKV